MSNTTINYVMFNRIYNYYQRKCAKSPTYFLLNCSHPNYCNIPPLLLINYINMPYIHNGEFIPKTNASNAPSVDIQFIADSGPYSLILNDPSSTFQSGNTIHWVIVNITPINGLYSDNTSLSNITTQGQQLYGRIIPLIIPNVSYLTNYIGPAPPINSGTHKYVFTLYNQNSNKITYPGPIHIEDSQQTLLANLSLLPNQLVTSLYFVSSYYP